MIILKLIKNRDRIKKTMIRIGILRRNRSKGKVNEGDVSPEREEAAWHERLHLETDHGKTKRTPSFSKELKTFVNENPVKKSELTTRVGRNNVYRPEQTLLQRHLEERKQQSAKTTSNLRDDGTVSTGVTCPSAPPINLYSDLNSQVPILFEPWWIDFVNICGYCAEGGHRSIIAWL